jgi:L-2,4-diaminobutyric acid acetyltransferase
MTLVYSHPKAADGTLMWDLVKNNEDLDLNSSYSYFLVSKLHSKRCIIAIDKENNRMAGFIMGFVFSDNPETYFIWQISVAKEYRGQGIGSTLINKLLTTNEDVRYIKGTVSKENYYYQNLLKKVALIHDSWYSIKESFEDDDFPDGHEKEQLISIGPIQR